MSESFSKISRSIFEQNWHLRPEIDSTQLRRAGAGPAAPPGPVRGGTRESGWFLRDFFENLGIL